MRLCYRWQIKPSIYAIAHLVRFLHSMLLVNSCKAQHASIVRFFSTDFKTPRIAYFFSSAAGSLKSGKQSARVLLCLFVACSVRLPRGQQEQVGRYGEVTYAGARVVFRKVDLQTWHWISFACSLTLSCDLATLVSLSLRSRLEAALAPWLWSASKSCSHLMGWRDEAEVFRNR
jgi:hypothetical protein